MNECINFIEKTIPILTFTSWYPGQSELNGTLSNQSIDILNIESEPEECSDVNYVADADVLEVLDDPSSEVAGHCGRNVVNGLDSLESQIPVMMSLQAKEQMCDEVKTYHKELPCLNIIIDDFDRTKLCKKEKDFNHNDYVKEVHEKEDLMKWYELPEDRYRDIESMVVKTPYYSPPVSISENTQVQELSSANSAESDTDEISDSQPSLTVDELDKLKNLAVRLKLQTRRSSYTTWRERLTQSFGIQSKRAEGQQKDGEEPKVTLQEKLDYIKSELVEIKKQDESLARQFISLRHEMQQIKLQQSRWAVEDMVDEAQWTIAENEELEHICDAPKKLDRTPLLTIGITKMNLTERRFSVF